MIINSRIPANPDCPYQDGDIVLSREDTYSSWIIRKFTSSEWSHAGIIFDESVLVSAVPMMGVCSRPLAIAKTRVIYRLKGITPLQQRTLKSFAYSSIGKKYDLKQVFLLGWRIITNTINKHGDDPRPDRFECLEFVGEAYDQIGIKFGKFVDNLLPNMIVNSNLVDKIEPAL